MVKQVFCAVRKIRTENEIDTKKMIFPRPTIALVLSLTCILMENAAGTCMQIFMQVAYGQVPKTLKIAGISPRARLLLLVLATHLFRVALCPKLHFHLWVTFSRSGRTTTRTYLS